MLEADYVVVGAGASALAFADTLLAESDASILLVDRRARPGGHWNDAYPFVRLHSPSSNYGVNSMPLGDGAIDTAGFNTGLGELASGADIRAYYDKLMRERLLPSGRVTFLPLHDFQNGLAVSVRSGEAIPVRARRKLVDATFTDTRLPSTHAPNFRVADDVRLLSPNELAAGEIGAGPYVLIGAGKTALDTAFWMLQSGVSPDAITWIRSRDPWLLNRTHIQPDYRFFKATMSGFVLEMEAARDAADMDDLFARLEQGGLLRRIDPSVTPSAYRCAIISDAELEQLRRIKNVVRMGRVESISRNEICLANGAIRVAPGTTFINCSADGIPTKPPQPIFQDNRILLQYTRRCSPTFSAAMIAFLEARLEDDAARNSMCAPIPMPSTPRDWLKMHLAEVPNRYAWSRSPAMQQWREQSRLDGYAGMIAEAMRRGNPAELALMARYRDAMQPGLANLKQLLAPAYALPERSATLGRYGRLDRRALRHVLSRPSRRGQRRQTGLGEEITLHEVDAQIAQSLKLADRFDALADGRDAEIAEHRERIAHDGLLDRALIHSTNEVHVELHEVGLKLGEQAEARVASAEVIDRGLEPHGAIRAQDVEHVRRIQALHLGELEDDTLNRETRTHRRRQRQPDACARLINGVWQEIDR